MSLMLNNLLTGQLPDAVGLLLFGVVMILSSTLIRRILGEHTVLETEEIENDRFQENISR